jgi:imidazolonepropionase
MSELNIVPRGALLIRNGVIEDVGPARRVENLAGARKARVIDATGKVVMPAFVDADVALVTTPSMRENGEREERAEAASLRLMSRKVALARAAEMSAEYARYGSVTVGAQTRCATDLKNIAKVLRTHQSLQMKPLRIRSVFAPQFPPGAIRSPAQLLEALLTKWLPSVKARKLATVVEFTAGGETSRLDNTMVRVAAVSAAGMGYAIRLRSELRPEPGDLQLALSAGAIAIVAPMDSLRAFAGPLADIGCVRVIPASEGFDDSVNAAGAIRHALDEGVAVALTSSYRTRASSTLNMQHVLHMAVHRLGLTEEEAITATTWNPACSLRLSHVTGSLEPGKSADVVMMDVPDYRELARRAGHHDVSLVMRAGQAIAGSAALSED